MTTERETETKTPSMSPVAAQRYWSVQITQAEAEHAEWWKEADTIWARYKNERKASTAKVKAARSYNILYSNVETQRAAIYARTAKPDVRPRYLSNNPISRAGAELLERCLVYASDDESHDTVMRMAVLDGLIAGRGVVRIVYEAEIGELEIEDPATGQMQQAPTSQEVCDHYVHYRDFLHSPAKCWEEVWWVSFRHLMTLDDLEANGFDSPDEIPRNWTPGESQNGRDRREISDELKRAEVFEVWHKPSRKRIWFVKGHTAVLRIDDDPLKLDDFFPMAPDLAFLRGTDSNIPVPEFRQYIDLADDLDENQSRISMITKALKRRGVYDSSIDELKRLAKAGDNEFIPVKNYQHLVQKGGLEAAFQTENIEVLAKVLLALHDAQERLEAKVDKITGISDIMRGEEDSSATATASNIKAQYGGLRIKDRQKAVQAFIRNLTRIKAEIIAEHFEPGTLQAMSEMEITPELMQMLRNDKLRCYAVDIETDSTVFEDAQAEKEARVEVTQALTGLLERGLAIMQVAPEMGELVFESMSALLKTMKGGRSLEDVVDRARQQMQQRMANPQPPPPDPKVEAMKIKAELDQQKATADLQIKQQTHEMDMQGRVLDLQLKGEEMAMDRERLAMEHESAQREHAVKAQGLEMDLDHKRLVGAIQLQQKRAAAKSRPKGNMH